MNSPLIISPANVEKTLTILQSAGRRHSECVVLWLGKRRNGVIDLELVWVPEQRAGEGFFDIPEWSMQALFAELRRQRLFVAAQVHTHPREAFHSYADDTWAIVRHAGALSFVLPYFALKTTLHTFVSDTAVFALSSENEWIEVPTTARKKHYQITR
jgi:hypothetical protein